MPREFCCPIRPRVKRAFVGRDIRLIRRYASPLCQEQTDEASSEQRQRAGFGRTNVPITPAEDSIPPCGSSRIDAYGYQSAKNLGSVDIGQGAVFDIARPSHHPLSCNLGDGAYNDGVICRRKAPSPVPHAPKL